MSTTAQGRSSMEEFRNLMLKAREILVIPSHEGVETLLNQLSVGQETTKDETAIAVFNILAAKFPNCLTLKLLEVYRSSSNDERRLQSISLLSQTLAECRNRNLELHLVALYDIKPLLISCLKMKETGESEIRILRRIVSFIAYDVVSRDNNGWDELSDCILEFTDTQPTKAFHVFIDLPPLYERFINRIEWEILERAEKTLCSPENAGVEDWSVGLETFVKMGIQKLDSEMRLDEIKHLLNVLVKSASDLVDKGMEEFLLQVLEHLERFLSRDINMYNYNKFQCDFVSTFLYKIKHLGTHTKEATSKIHLLFKSSHSSPIQQEEEGQLMENPQDQLSTLSPLKLLRIFASTQVEERTRELAIIKLNLLLSHHTSREAIIGLSEMRELQPILINCLWRKEGISESMFKVLGEVVYHVACEMMNVYNEIWSDLRHYIASNIKTEFQRTVYIFQCLTMWLDDVFVIPIVENLLPEICSSLNPPKELLVDNSRWVLAFVGAFCAAVHLVEDETCVIKEVVGLMIGSVRELVERGMELGLVRRAFRDVESIVKKQEDWFNKNEYKFIKDLLRRLYEIKGMKMESRMVLWRINVFVNRGISKLQDQED